MAKEIDRDFDNCDCECDYCGQSETVYSTDYREINKELRDMGWIIRKIDVNGLNSVVMNVFKNT